MPTVSLVIFLFIAHSNLGQDPIVPQIYSCSHILPPSIQKGLSVSSPQCPQSATKFYSLSLWAVWAAHRHTPRITYFQDVWAAIDLWYSGILSKIIVCNKKNFFQWDCGHCGLLFEIPFWYLGGKMWSSYWSVVQVDPVRNRFQEFYQSITGISKKILNKNDFIIFSHASKWAVGIMEEFDVLLIREKIWSRWILLA